MRMTPPPADPWREVVAFEFWRGPIGGVRCRLFLHPCGHVLAFTGRRLPKRRRCGVCGARAFVAWLFPLRVVGDPWSN